MKLTDEEKAEIRALYAEGKTKRWIAEWIGCHDSTVRTIVEADVRERRRLNDRARRQRLAAERSGESPRP